MKSFFKKIPYAQRKGFYSQGFTLVELMVALTLFVIVVLAAVSSLYSVNNASRKVNAMRVVLDNLNFAVESISRTVRTGDTLVCGSYYDMNASSRNCTYDDSSGDDSFYIHSRLGQDLDVEYRFWQPDGERGEIQKRSSPAEAEEWSDWVAITAPEIDVENLRFYVAGADEDDLTQPSISMFIEGIATSEEAEAAPFSIQTFISQRAFE